MSAMVRESRTYKKLLLGLAIGGGVGVAAYLVYRKIQDQHGHDGKPAPAGGAASARQQQQQPKDETPVAAAVIAKEDEPVSEEAPKPESTPVQAIPVKKKPEKDGSKEGLAPLVLPTETTPGESSEVAAAGQESMSESHSSFVNLSMSQSESPTSLDTNASYEKLSMSQVQDKPPSPPSPVPPRSPTPPTSMDESIEPISMSQVCEEPVAPPAETPADKKEEKTEEEKEKSSDEEESSEEEEETSEEELTEEEKEDSVIEKEESAQSEVAPPVVQETSQLPDVAAQAAERQEQEQPPVASDMPAESRELETKDENDIVVIGEKPVDVKEGDGQS